MYELIITEKPNAASKIAAALADGKAIKENNRGVPYYKVTHGSKDLVVACAVGHLYGLAEKEKKGWKYPVFDVEWKPTADTRKEAAYSKKYLQTIKKLVKDADSYTVATDYDIEGEVIGYNVVKHICRQKDAARMKFSTLTKPDLVKAYENKSKRLNWGQVNAGLARHEMDWYYGINLSRALTAAIKSIGRFKIMSSGRVQGPALKIVVDREKEIKAFKPVPYWQIQLLGSVKKGDIEAWHKEDKFWEKEKADAVMEKTKGHDAKVAKLEKKRFNQAPPTPFDLTTLQTESYRCHGISPKETLAIAQDLYTSGYISYPRTSSQKLPKEIGHKKILNALAKQEEYAELARNLLSRKSLAPNQGKKTDPAHPAIYPTGISPKLDGRKNKIYDIIVKRFMATFAEPAVRETMIIDVDCNSEMFIAKGTRTVERGWHVFYDPYVKLEEQELPKVSEGDDVKVNEINLLDKETQPPKRYTPASIIRELEKRNLGTKSTRAQIVDTLFQRGYVQGPPLEATDIGIHTIETLEKYIPRIVDEELTRHFEVEMEGIDEGKKKKDEVLDEAKKLLIDILGNFKKKEKEIGEGLFEANKETLTKANTVGSCPNCDDGTLMMRRGKFGRFIACDKYPDCKTTFKLPAAGMVKTSEKTCDKCRHPLISIMKKRRSQEICINPHCPGKQEGHDKETKKEMKKIESGDVKKQCPKCRKGNLVLRKSIYGSFYGCSSYPKCRYTEKIGNGNNNK